MLVTKKSDKTAWTGTVRTAACLEHVYQRLCLPTSGPKGVPAYLRLAGLLDMGTRQDLGLNNQMTEPHFLLDRNPR